MEAAKFKERNMPDGAKLLSIIDRLSEQNVLSASLQKKATFFSGTKESESITRGNTRKTNFSRRRRKNTVTKVHRCDKSEEVNDSKVCCGIDSLPEAKPEVNGEKSENKPSPEASDLGKQSTALTDHLCSNGITPAAQSFSKKIKLTLKAEISSEGKPSLCLCKSVPLVHNSGNSDCNERNFREPKLPHSLSENLAKNPSETFTDSDQKNERSSLKSNFLKDIAVQPRSSSLYSTSKSSCICGICLKQFSSVFFLEKHRKQSKHYLCSGCGEAFYDSTSYEQHVERKECKAFGCTICGKKFMFHDELSTHETEEHFKCPECKKCFLNTEKLSAHHDSCHGDRTHYRCHECGKSFFAHSRYKTHVMAAHTGERPYVCSECGKGFARMYGLTTHMRYTHCDEKKFQCEFCPKTFKRKDHLKSHQVIHLSKKPYYCQDCGKGFNQKVSLKRHKPCSNQAKPVETKDIGIGTEDGEKIIVKNKIAGSSIANGVSEKEKNSTKFTMSVVKTGKNHRSAVREYLGCHCPANCGCKKFTIAVNVDCKDSHNSRGDFREVATLPCCCDIDLGKATVPTTGDQ